MGLLDIFRRRPEAPGDARATDLAVDEAPPSRPHDHWVAKPAPTNSVRGESYHLDDFRKVVGRRRPHGYLQEVEVELIREPENPHDANAIRVEVAGVELGHIARDVAAEIAPQLDDAGCATCLVRGLIRGGRSAASALGEGHYGLHLWLDDVLRPRGLTLTSRAAQPCAWPPNIWEGRGECPDCGAYAWMRVERPGRLACDRCGREWADPS